MRVLVVPNSFRDCMTAAEAARAIGTGVRRVYPHSHVVEVPLADGGDGTLEALAPLQNSTALTVSVHDPLGRIRTARLLYCDASRTAIVELAEASGLRTVDPQQRDPLRSSTYGTGELIRFALTKGARHVLVGLGGSATLDAGAGAIAALGAVFRDATGRELLPCPAALENVADIDLSKLDSRLRDVKIRLLADVSTPLVDNLRTFGGQKGIKPQDVRVFDTVLHKLANLAATRGVDILNERWLGAGGGTGAMLRAFAGATAESGAGFIVRLAKIPEQLHGSSLVITGEGHFDQTTFAGKLPIVIGQLAESHNVPTLVVAGCVDADVRDRLPSTSSVFAISPDADSSMGAIKTGPRETMLLTEQLLRLFRSAIFRQLVSDAAPYSLIGESL